MPLTKRPHQSDTPTQDVEPTYEELLTSLASDDSSARRIAARGLGQYPQAADALCGAVKAETDESVREPLFTALIRIGSPAAADGLIPLLRSEDVGLRNGATEALKTMPDAVAEHFDELFSGSYDVRIFAAEIVGALAHPQAAIRLIATIEHDPEVNVCAAAVQSLGDLGDERAIEPLRRLMERFPGEPFLEFSIRAALSQIADM